MKTMTATEAKNRLGEVLSIPYGESVLIEKNGKPAFMVLKAQDAKVMILASYVQGVVSRSTAMRLLGFEWYGELLDALAEEGFKRPSVPEDRLNEMAAKAVSMLREAGAV